MEENKNKHVIHVEKNCAWCEVVPEEFIYGKDEAEVETALEDRAKRRAALQHN